MVQQTTDLRCIYDSRASFYSKAKVITHANNKVSLVSYNTEVAVFDPSKNELLVKASEYSKNGKYSTTTTRHIREFARQNGFWELKIIRVGTYSKK
jgi:esterase/lipase superfamily enzyme